MGTRLLLTRHGQTVWHAENRYAGSSEVDLTEEGLAQAERLATVVTARQDPPVALYCSPQDRARRTAEPAARALGLRPRIVEDLRETHFGVGEGRTRAELAETDPEVVERFLANPVTGAFPGAEPPAEAAARGAAALREIAAAETGPVLVVAHNTLLRLALCELLGIPLHTYRTVLPLLANASPSEVDIDGTRTGLLSLNSIPPHVIIEQ
ncbi:histidine phosphatase family protein [Amycolatopsis sp. 195334CR]|uniref:histidine phosphatase family protein n=1 Tax=Amycolatopsis sp. 195334CR TaxID=2814588 RepID=UPI001A8C3B0D|nr:histidine phosphatase family protein [Amycolatopsis sp. 195334CR]MBN6036922.1 histidine phosphatase family protein [Amycolatopsis sp. 195334CR]